MFLKLTIKTPEGRHISITPETTRKPYDFLMFSWGTKK